MKQGVKLKNRIRGHPRLMCQYALNVLCAVALLRCREPRFYVPVQLYSPTTPPHQPPISTYTLASPNSSHSASTAGPRITFCSMSLCYNVNERKEVDSQPGPLSEWSFHAFPTSVCIFPQHSGFLPDPKDVYVR